MAFGLGKFSGISRVSAALVALAVLSGSSAFAQSGLMARSASPTGPVFGDEVAPTVGAALWCNEDPDEVFCRGVARYQAIELDADTAIAISKVNMAVNVEVEPVDDIELWNVPERWNRPTRGANGRLMDDCDGYVIEKWYRLVEEQGYPKEAFYPLYADVPGYGGHLVLAVITDKGTFVLDNLHDDIVPLKSFSFTFLKRPQPGQSLNGVWERYLAFG